MRAERVGIAAEEPRHLGGRFQMALGIGDEAKAGLVDGAMLADAGQHILQRPPLGDVVEHVVDGDERQPGSLGQRRQAGEAPRIVAAIEMLGGEIDMAGKIRRDPRQANSANAVILGRSGGSTTTICPSPWATRSA